MISKTAMITICGRPNVGKSTLTNALAGEKIAIVSNKPQTTRNRITAVCQRGETQFVFLDTPGFHKPRTRLGDYMVNVVRQSVADVDAVVLVVEPVASLGPQERELIASIKAANCPAVEAGERLGFLPGDLQSKVDPYLRPLYDALFDMLGPETYNTYLEKGNIEVAPLAYMRGRTLDDSFIILDEAQNTSREQMKMFLTRLGFNSKMVITGDVTQIDLPADKASGLKEAMKVLDGVDDIAICRFTGADVVRHALVQQIIAAYEKHEKAAAAAAEREKKTAAPQRRDNSGYNNYKRK